MADELARLVIEVRSDSAKAAGANLADLTAKTTAATAATTRQGAANRATESTLLAVLAAAREGAQAQRELAAATAKAADDAMQSRRAQAAQRDASRAAAAAAKAQATAEREAAAAIKAAKAEATRAAKQAEREQVAAARAIAAAEKAAARDVANAAKESARAKQGFSLLFDALGPIGTAISGAFAVSRITAMIAGTARMADSFQLVGQRVKLFSTSVENANAVQAQLVTLAVQTRAPIEDIARIYSRISAVSGDLGASQADVLRLTKGIAQTFTLSGASAAEAASSGQQLAQALGSGTLAGDELKSIMENNLVLAQAIATGFGVSVGQLKKMGAEGKLTSEGVFKALLSQTDAIAARAGTIAPTMESGFAAFNSGLTSAIGRMDTLLGITSKIGKLLESIGQFLADPDSFRGLQNIGAFINGVVKFGNEFLSGDFRAAGETLFKNTQTKRSGSPLAERQEFARQSTQNPLFTSSGGFTAPTESAGAFRFSDAFKQQSSEIVMTGGAIADALGKPNTAGAKKAADAARDAAKKAADAADALIDTTLRRLNAFGDSLDVQSQTLPIRQQRELSKAITEFGAGSEQVSALMAAQADELAVLGQKIAVQKRETERQVRQADIVLKGLVRGPETRTTISATDIIRIDRADGIAAMERAEQDAEAAAERSKALFQSLVNSLQTTFSNGLQGLFTKGLSSLNDFARSIKDTILRAFSDILASSITRRLLEAFAGSGGIGGIGGGASLASGGGLLSSAASFGGVKALGGLLKGGKAANPFALPGLGTQLVGGAAAAGAGIFLGNSIGSRNGTTAGVLGGAASGAAAGAAIGSFVPVLGTGIGALIGGIGGAIGGLFGGNSKKKKAREAARQLAEDSAAFADELIVRSLEASGDSFAAETKRLEQRNKAELDAVAARFGKGSKQVMDVKAIQDKEMANRKRDDDTNALASGTYLAPSGFSANAYRFNAGRPTTPMLPPSNTITTGAVTIVVPQGTPREQAQQIVRELQSLANSQGLPSTQWFGVDVQ